MTGPDTARFDPKLLQQNLHALTGALATERTDDVAVRSGIAALLLMARGLERAHNVRVTDAEVDDLLQRTAVLRRLGTS